MQAYSDPCRESDPYALPDVEVWQSYWEYCPECERVVLTDELLTVACPDCETVFRMTDPDKAWFWWSCFPGCLPDSDPIGPFDTEEKALADAQEGMGDDDDEA